MCQIPIRNAESEILQRVAVIERSIREGLQRIEQQLSRGSETFAFYSEALGQYRNRILKEQGEEFQRGIIDRLREKFCLDKELRYPHRKILDFLLSRYDFQTGHFQEVIFSELVDGARVGKGTAKQYLTLLGAKGYIVKRSDGYRIYFKIAQEDFTDGKEKVI